MDPEDDEETYLEACMRAFDPDRLRAKKHHEPLDALLPPIEDEGTKKIKRRT